MTYPLTALGSINMLWPAGCVSITVKSSANSGKLSSMVETTTLLTDTPLSNTSSWSLGRKSCPLVARLDSSVWSLTATRPLVPPDLSTSTNTRDPSLTLRAVGRSWNTPVPPSSSNITTVALVFSDERRGEE